MTRQLKVGKDMAVAPPHQEDVGPFPTGVSINEGYASIRQESGITVDVISGALVQRHLGHSSLLYLLAMRPAQQLRYVTRYLPYDDRRKAHIAKTCEFKHVAITQSEHLFILTYPPYSPKEPRRVLHYGRKIRPLRKAVR